MLRACGRPCVLGIGGGWANPASREVPVRWSLAGGVGLGVGRKVAP